MTPIKHTTRKGVLACAAALVCMAAFFTSTAATQQCIPESAVVIVKGHDEKQSPIKIGIDKKSQSLYIQSAVCNKYVFVGDVDVRISKIFGLL